MLMLKMLGKDKSLGVSNMATYHYCRNVNASFEFSKRLAQIQHWSTLRTNSCFSREQKKKC